MKQQPEQIAKRFAQCYVGDVIISAMTFAELEYGVTMSQNSARERSNHVALVEDIEVVPFDARAAAA